MKRVKFVKRVLSVKFMKSVKTRLRLNERQNTSPVSSILSRLIHPTVNR